MIVLLILGVIGSVTSNDEIMTTKMKPNKGPEMDTVYVAGNPGGQWTKDEIDSTRRRIIQMIHPDWDIKRQMGTCQTNVCKMKDESGDVTENVLMRLAFHDCIPYSDGTGGCDGCLNYQGMGAKAASQNNHGQWYKFKPLNATDNNKLDNAVKKLELVYTTIDWPFVAPSLEISLHQSGKSRADLWQLAGLIALELALERANRACDLDYHLRQQVRLLESRDKCIIKLNKPLKFLTGRKDCVPDDPKFPYRTTKYENHPKVFGDANHIIDYGKIMNVDTDKWMALQGVHAGVHAVHIGMKYTWFGPGYISNMYFKMIANHPRYGNHRGGDLAFTSKGPLPVQNKVYGEPSNMTTWFVSCGSIWNTTEGGPCPLRPRGPPGIGVKEPTDPWRDDMSRKEKQKRHVFNNQFAFPWEVGMYHKFSIGGVGQRPVGCPGLDDDFGELPNAKWPYRNSNSPIWASRRMDCDKNDYAPEGRPVYEIVDELASDNSIFAEKLLEGWQQMTSNGYAVEELVDGPENGWFGHYSLSEQGKEIDNFENYIKENKPVEFTDVNADPWICGHRGHASFSCGYRFSEYMAAAENGVISEKVNKWVKENLRQ